MRLILGSGGFAAAGAAEDYKAALAEHFKGASSVLFVPYALHDHDGVTAWMAESGFDGGVPHVGLHTFPDPVAAIESAEALHVSGGNTFRLVHALHELKLLEVVRRRVAGGMPYAGASAGANVACRALWNTNDMPIIEPQSFETFCLVPFQINPHYYSGPTWRQDEQGQQVEHGGETRDERIQEFHEVRSEPVLGLREGSWLEVTSSTLDLRGRSARLFRRDQEAEDLAPGSSLHELMDLQPEP